jgi:hypothetical protein
VGVRAKGKLAIGAVAALSVAGAVAALTATHSGMSHHGGGRSHTRPQSSKEVYGIFGAFGISYGTRPRQLLARLGAPDRKRAGCWIYRIRGGTFHGFKLIPEIARMDTVRYCFFSGVVSIIEDHWRPAHPGSPDPQPWIAPLEFGCGGRPCKLAY